MLVLLIGVEHWYEDTSVDIVGCDRLGGDGEPLKRVVARDCSLGILVEELAKSLELPPVTRSEEASRHQEHRVCLFKDLATTHCILLVQRGMFRAIANGHSC